MTVPLLRRCHRTIYILRQLIDIFFFVQVDAMYALNTLIVTKSTFSWFW